jgi:hypothetical protein
MRTWCVGCAGRTFCGALRVIVIPSVGIFLIVSHGFQPKPKRATPPCSQPRCCSSRRSPPGQQRAGGGAWRRRIPGSATASARLASPSRAVARGVAVRSTRAGAASPTDPTTSLRQAAPHTAPQPPRAALYLPRRPHRCRRRPCCQYNRPRGIVCRCRVSRPGGRWRCNISSPSAAASTGRPWRRAAHTGE